MTRDTIRPRQGNLNSLRGLLIVQQHEVTVMKLLIVAVTTVIALSSPAFAQTFSSDGLNGATLGKSMRGVYNGVPYPNTNLTNGTATVGSSGGRQYGAAHWYHKHYRHHRHSGM